MPSCLLNTLKPEIMKNTVTFCHWRRFLDEIRIWFLTGTDMMTLMPLKWQTSLAPEYPLGVVRPKLESRLSMGAPLLAGIDSLVMTVLLMVLVVMMMIQGDYSDKGCLRDCDSVRMVNNHSQSLFLINITWIPHSKNRISVLTRVTALRCTIVRWSWRWWSWVAWQG